MFISNLKTAAIVFIFIATVGIVWAQGQVIKNQKLQMKQQFHSDFIALVSLFGEDGLNKLFSAKTSQELTKKEEYTTGLLLQRFLVAYSMKDAWTAEEWRSIEKDIKVAMKVSELLRSRWEQIRSWYPKNEQEFLDGIMFSVMDEKTKLEILRDRLVNEK